MRPSVGGIACAGLALLCSCGTSADSQTGGTAHVHISITGGGDTVGFRIPVRARRCGDGHGVVLDGGQHGNGLLVWLRNGVGSPDSGTYSLLSRGDSAAPRGAITSIRYIFGTVAHGIIVDSGTATLAREQPPYAIHVKGNGAEVAIPARRSVELNADNVPLESDTVNCGVQL
ncbi:MAG: hypothetical protein ACM3OA_08980 [Acidobacteriota bacterium]